jgi:NAD(P)-dependent dehydrogenase (short-subunit alcohol dehydrogenase family)
MQDMYKRDLLRQYRKSAFWATKTFGYCSQIVLLGQEKLMEQLDTNMFGSINLTNAFLPQFRERKASTIAFISTIFSWYGQPCAGPYAISKHGLAAELPIYIIEQTKLTQARLRRNSQLGSLPVWHQSHPF